MADSHSLIVEAARKIWAYHLLQDKLVKSDLILVLGSDDPRVAERGIELWQKGMAPLILFSGGVGKLTEGMYGMPEADYFAEMARKAGIPEEAILIEDESGNTGENITLSTALLEREKISWSSVILIQKPFMERRTLAVFRNYFPTMPCCVTSPRISFEQYPSDSFPFDHMLNVMIGDLQRIKEYPALGFQIPQKIPEEVWNSALYLISHGYDKHLIPGTKPQ